MKILFVSSGNNINGISPIIKNQGTSLECKGIEIIYFSIKGKGLLGYLKNIPRLRRSINKYSPDIVHAHYSLCGFVASLAGANKLVVSLMGSDVKSGTSFKSIIKYFIKYKWGRTIVKSEDMKSSLGVTDIEVIPNGVDLERFRPLSKKHCQKKLGWDINKKHILFAADPKRPVKNFTLAEEAMKSLDNPNYQLHYLNNVKNSEMPIYHNAADVVLLTSLWEGSPNVIKEAMACNRPIVATDVGDISFLFGKTDDCYICLFDTKDCASKISKALTIESTNALERLKYLELDSVSVSDKIVDVYKSIL